jgi:WD40 repeat protein
VGEVKALALPEEFLVRRLAFDPKGRYLFAVGNRDRTWIVPLDGSAPRRLQGFSEDTLLNAAAVSPSGRLVATAFFYGEGEKTLRVWNLETGELRRYDLPESRAIAGGATAARTGYEQGIVNMAFEDESVLYTEGDGGLRRWNLDTGSQTLVAEASWMAGPIAPVNGTALTVTNERGACSILQRELASGTSRAITQFGECGAVSMVAVDASGTVAATASLDGTVRVGRLSGGQPHLLVGHRGSIDRIAISPDLRWVATTGGDNTLRLWPMPDLSKPPLHTWSHDELLAKLRSLTNLRVVRDSASVDVWKVEVGPFPGWKHVPTW